MFFPVKGYNVTVYDLDQPILDHAKELIRSNLTHLKEQNRLHGEMIDAVMARVTFPADLEAALKDAEFIQESGPERPKGVSLRDFKPRKNIGIVWSNPTSPMSFSSSDKSSCLNRADTGGTHKTPKERAGQTPHPLKNIGFMRFFLT